MADDFKYTSSTPADTDDQTSGASLGQPSTNQASQTGSSSITWQSSEFIEHEKNLLWFVYLGVSTLVLAVIIYFVTKNILAVVVVVLLAVAIAQFAKSKPAVNEYELSNHGLKINGQFHAISSFKSFSVYKEGAIDALNLVSSRRLVPDLTIYFAPDDRDKILGVLQRLLPQSVYKPATIDKLAARTKF